MADRIAFHLRRRWPVQVSVAACLIAALASSIALSTETSNDAQDTQVITIENMQFNPAQLTVNRGTRIVWKNRDLFPHTATGKHFDSGTIEADKSWTYVANEPGDFAYLCSFHPTMKGRLIVR